MRFTLLPDSMPTRLLKFFFTAGCLSLLVACGTPTMKPEQASSIRRVGIVSLLPSDLRYEKIGVTVFNNERTTRPVGDVFNVAARSTAERLLNQAGRQTMQLMVDVPTFSRRLLSGVIFFDSPAERISDELVKMAAANKLDAIVLITESFDAENGIHGVRMYLRAGMGDIRFAVASGDLGTLVVDANAKKLATQGRGTSFAVERPQGQPWGYVLEDNLDRPTEERVTAQMVKIIESVVDQQLRAMGF